MLLLLLPGFCFHFGLVAIMCFSVSFGPMPPLRKRSRQLSVPPTTLFLTPVVQTIPCFHCFLLFWFLCRLVVACCCTISRTIQTSIPPILSTCKGWNADSWNGLPRRTVSRRPVSDPVEALVLPVRSLQRQLKRQQLRRKPKPRRQVLRG